jgi:outer membrane protein W
MKKSLLLVFLMTAVIAAVSAQEYKSFRVGLGLGYASPGGEGSKGGVLFYLEPSYRVNDQLAVGLRMEGAVVGRVAVVANSTGGSAEAEVSANGSYTVNGQYYFSNNTFRPFAGLGLGIYSLASAKVSGSSSGTGSGSSEVSAGSKFGFYPRVGFDLGHFTMMVEYNIIPSTTANVVVTSGTGTTTAESETKNSYLGIKFGFFIGGGKI